jgi:predicted nuclease of predicted toxin-antitoxin system
MRFLADENFPAAAIRGLIASGHDVVSIRLVAPGATDREVLARALDERRVLLTFDKDFGELAAGSGLPATCGIVLFRTRAPRTPAQTRRFVELLISRADWVGHFSVIEPERVRMRPLK